MVQLEEPLLDQAQAKMRDLQTSILELEATTGNLPTTIKAMGGAAKSVGGASTGMTITFDSRTLSELSSGQSSADGASVGGAPVLYPRPPVDLSFIRDAVVELLKCRRVLKASYGYGFYLKRLVSTRQFEHMQVRPLSVCLSVCLSVFCLPVFLSHCLSFYLTVVSFFLSISLSVFLSHCLSL